MFIAHNTRVLSLLGSYDAITFVRLFFLRKNNVYRINRFYFCGTSFPVVLELIPGYFISASLSELDPPGSGGLFLSWTLRLPRKPSQGLFYIYFNVTKCVIMSLTTCIQSETLYTIDNHAIHSRDWRGAGFTCGPAVTCIFLRAVRVYDIDCGVGAGPRAVNYCGPLRACMAYAVQCGPMFYIAFNFVIEKMFPFIKGFHKEMICCIACKCVFV